jgi:hypothetical protein
MPAHLARPSPELLARMESSITEIKTMQLLAQQMGAELVVAIIRTTQLVP